MENGTVEQGVTAAVDEQSISDEHPIDDGAGDGALDEGQLASESEQGEFDPNSPEARHWQSVADKRVGKLESELRTIKNLVTRTQVKQAQPQAAEPSMDDILSVETFRPPAIPLGELENLGFDDRSIAAVDQRMQTYMREWTKHVLTGITAHNQRLMAQGNEARAKQTLTSFVDTLTPEQAESFLPLYDKYESMATGDTEAFLEFAKTKLGIGAKPAPQAQPRRGLASVVQASSTRPTRNTGTTPMQKKAETVRDGVLAAVRAQLRR